MPTWGYGLVAILALALSIYALWPERVATGIAPIPDPIAAQFIVTGALGEQQVGAERVLVAGMDRPVDPQAVSGFRSSARFIRSESDQVIENIDAKAARAWGVDGTRRLVSGTEERAWGEADGLAAVWDPARHRAYLVRPGDLHRMVLAASRLDAKELLDAKQMPRALTIDGVGFELRDGHWSAVGGTRPPCDGRLSRLTAMLNAATLDGPGSAPAEAITEHELRWTSLDGKAVRLRLLGLGERAWLAVDGLPAQEQTVDRRQALREALAALAVDRPCDPPGMSEITKVQVSRAGTEVLRLEHRGELTPQGQPWAVVWPGGAEPSDAGWGDRLANLLCGLNVTGARRGPAPDGPAATTITVSGGHGPMWNVALSGDQVWSGGWIGTCAKLPAPLDDLRPDAFLDLRPCPLDASRTVKLQRRWPGDGREEVAARAPGGTWRRSWPKAGSPLPLDEAAVQRVVRALCRLRGRSVRLTSPIERSLPADVELAVRIAPKETQHTGVEDEVELEETMPQERGWRLSRLGDGWTMVEIDGALTFDLDAGSVEELLADITSDRVFPLAPALVSAIEVGGGAPFRLENRGASWTLRRGAEGVDADPLAVRRLLRALTTLSARKPLAGTASTAGAVPVAVETSEGERIAITFAAPDADGIPVLTAHGGLLIEDRAAWALVDLRPATYAKP